MVAPTAFTSNAEAAQDNKFMHGAAGSVTAQVLRGALRWWISRPLVDRRLNGERFSRLCIAWGGGAAGDEARVCACLTGPLVRSGVRGNLCRV